MVVSVVLVNAYTFISLDNKSFLLPGGDGRSDHGAGVEQHLPEEP